MSAFVISPTGVVHVAREVGPRRYSTLCGRALRHDWSLRFTLLDEEVTCGSCAAATVAQQRRAR